MSLVIDFNRTFRLTARPYDATLVDLIRDLPGRRYHPDTKAWHVPAKAAEAVLDLIEETDAIVEEAAKAQLLAVCGRLPETNGGAPVAEFPPTAEQQAVLDAARDGGDVICNAYAGAGKTSTLVHVAALLAPKRGIYLAFNRSTAEEARKRFPKNVECSTTHSVALRAVNRNNRYAGKVGKRLGYPKELAQLLGIPREGFAQRSQIHLVYGILGALKLFAQSADSQFGEQHLPANHLAAVSAPDDETGQVNLGRINRWKLATLWGAQRLFQLSIDPEQPHVGLSHDVYLKLWQLSGGTLDYDFVLVDEAQDLNPVTLAVVAAQPIQKIWVGDTHQQIYAWRGAVNAMESVDGRPTYITQSFRWGPAVAEVANAILAAKQVPLPHPVRGFEKKQTVLGEVTYPYTLISRGNSLLFAAALEAVDAGRRIAAIGSLREPIALMESAWALREGRTADVEHEDLKAFARWEELAVAAEEDYQLAQLAKRVEQYRNDIPDLCDKLRQAGEVAEAAADVVLTTCHKAKGREWANVRLAYDFPCHAPDEEPEVEEVNILYVAATRATERLELNKAAGQCLDAYRAQGPTPTE